LLWAPDWPHGYLAEKRGTLDPLQRFPYACARIRICRAAQKQPHACRWRLCVKASDRWPQANVVADPCCREAASEHRCLTPSHGTPQSVAPHVPAAPRARSECLAGYRRVRWRQ